MSGTDLSTLSHGEEDEGGFGLNRAEAGIRLVLGLNHYRVIGSRESLLAF